MNGNFCLPSGHQGHLAYVDPAPGNQPAVLLLHGLGANSTSWQLQIPAMVGAGLRPLAVDLPGFGASRFTRGRWSIQAAAATAADLVERLGLDSLHVVGISMGGTVALQYALDHPAAIQKLVLVNTFARLRPERRGNALYYLRRFLVMNLMGLEAQAQLVARRILPYAEQAALRDELVRQILTSDRRTYRSAMVSLALFNIEARLARLVAPTLVISGERDTTVALPNQRALAEKIPGARHVLVKDAGHAVPVEKAGEFNRIVLEFLAPSH